MEILRNYAMAFVGREFIPGNHAGREPRPYASHFIQELLAGIGACPDDGIATPQLLFDYYQEASAWKVYQVGSLAFYGKDALNIDHVGMLIDPWRIVECGERKPFVRMRPISYREDLITVMKPRFHLMGVPDGLR
ncbi:MAG: hypothetical protein ACXWQJ_14080 [Bdellovibrionota bacterium]